MELETETKANYLQKCQKATKTCKEPSQSARRTNVLIVTLHVAETDITPQKYERCADLCLLYRHQKMLCYKR